MATRFLLAWGLGTAIPVAGVLVIGIAFLAGTDATGTDLAVAMVVLGGGALTVGFLAILLAARATVAPVNAVRRALTEVRDGEFDVQVPVYDGTQIGDLQLGFNQMVHGLAERQRIREALGAYVDPDVAEQILEEGTDLSGESVDVTVLFVDVRDFTASPSPARPRRWWRRSTASSSGSSRSSTSRAAGSTSSPATACWRSSARPAAWTDHADCALAAAREIQKAAADLGDFELGDRPQLGRGRGGQHRRRRPA